MRRRDLRLWIFLRIAEEGNGSPMKGIRFKTATNCVLVSLERFLSGPSRNSGEGGVNSKR